MISEESWAFRFSDVHVVVGNMLVACHQVGKSYQSINQVQSMVEANCYAQFQ